MKFLIFFFLSVLAFAIAFNNKESELNKCSEILNEERQFEYFYNNHTKEEYLGKTVDFKNSKCKKLNSRFLYEIEFGLAFTNCKNHGKPQKSQDLSKCKAKADKSKGEVHYCYAQFEYPLRLYSKMIGMLKMRCNDVNYISYNYPLTYSDFLENR